MENSDKIDESLRMNEYSGTFRWKRDIKMQSIDFSKVDFSKVQDWASFTNELTSIEFNDLKAIYIDSLSFGLTIASSIEKAVEYTDSLKEQSALNIVLLGCSGKAEERIARETNFFETVWFYLKSRDFKLLESIQMFFVGPEIENITEKAEKTVKMEFYKQTTGEFLKDNALSLDKENTILFPLNPGFGAGYLKLSLSWLSDLIKILKLGYFTVSTYTNDYEDLKGEQAILSLLHYKLKSQWTNKFSFMTTMTDGSDSQWNCGNYGCYAYQSCNKVKLKKAEKLDLAKEVENTLKDLNLLKYIAATPLISRI